MFDPAQVYLTDPQWTNSWPQREGAWSKISNLVYSNTNLGRSVSYQKLPIIASFYFYGELRGLKIEDGIVSESVKEEFAQVRKVALSMPLQNLREILVCETKIGKKLHPFLLSVMEGTMPNPLQIGASMEQVSCTLFAGYKGRFFNARFSSAINAGVTQQDVFREASMLLEVVMDHYAKYIADASSASN